MAGRTKHMTPEGGNGSSKPVRIRIREAGEDDLDEIVDLWEELVEHHQTYSDHFTLSRNGREIWEEYLREKFSEPSTKLIVAEENDGLVGFMLCLLDPARPIFKEKAVGLVSDAYVVKNRRKKGVMKEMLIVALRWFEKNRIRTAEVSILPANLEARAAWVQLGFKPFMIRKRMDLRSRPARTLIEGKAKSKAKRVVRRDRVKDG
ncbi:MAG: GNAT family N-acetyltransferase [Methanobacteriota archaeon]|nr:MAG: GNAT family N-acetyltransferase [Euryarchaeota archaeon]